jgi:ubiquinone/menaquinone biosynthesis C-methylase UbiE
VTIDESTRLLDVGCGAGRFCQIARDRGARVAELDATPAFIEIARERVPDGAFEVGDMEELPWPDDSFDGVTGFNSFFIAADMVGALREARRVARPGGNLALSILGRPERCDSTASSPAMRRLVEGEAASEESEPTAPEPPALHEEEVIVGVAREAALEPTECAYLGFAEEYPDVETMLRGMLAAPPARKAIRATTTEAARDALSEAVRPYVGADGAVRLQEEVRYLIATTRSDRGGSLSGGGGIRTLEGRNRP